MKKQKLLFNYISTLAYVWLASFGILFSIMETFYISYNRKQIYIAGSILCAVIASIVFFMRKNKMITVFVIGLAGEMLLLFAKWNEVSADISFIAQEVRSQMVSYFQTSGKKVTIENSFSQIGGVLFLFIMIVTLVICGIICCRKAWLLTTMIGLAILLPFLVGKTPENHNLILLGVTLMGAAFSKMGSGEQNEMPQIEMLGICAGILAFIIGATVIQKPLEGLFDQRKDIRGKVEDFFDWDTEKIFPERKNNNSKENTGVNRGELGQVDELNNDNRVHLKVTMKHKPKERMYLQGYIGVDYTAEKWVEAWPYDLSNWMKNISTGDRVDNLAFMKIETLGDEVENQKDRVTIECVNANNDFLYRPYISLTEEKTLSDTYVIGTNEKSYMFDYYPYQLLNGMQEQTNISFMEEEYERFVQEMYGKERVPNHVLEVFGSTVSQNLKWNTIDELGVEITELLAKNTRYSLKPGRTPEGKDFAEYFFFENRQGYCSHYATVATLMFRISGVPARYVGGYVIEPNEFEKDRNGNYQATVRGKSAHAWTEVYKKGKGWVPIETTPGYVEKVPEEEKTLEETIPIGNDKSNEITPTEKEPPKEKEVEKKPEKHENTSYGIYLLIGAAVIVGVVIASQIRKYCKRKRRKAVAIVSYNIKVQEVFHRIYAKLLSEKVVEKDIPLNEIFIGKLCEEYERITREDAEKMLDIVYRANFGKDILGKTEYRFVRRILFLLEKKE